MRKFRKPVSLLLAMIMVLSVFTIIPAVTASAEDEFDIISDTEAVSAEVDVDGEWIKGTIAAQSWSADGIYSFGELKDKVIFCRIKKDEAPAFADGICYNQTADLAVPTGEENTWQMTSWFEGTWYNYTLEGTVSGQYIDVRNDTTRNDVDWYAWTWDTLTLTLTKHEAKAPTANEGGNVEYYTADGGRYFVADGETYKQVSEDDVKLDKLDKHSLTLKAAANIGINFYIPADATDVQINGEAAAPAASDIDGYQQLQAFVPAAEMTTDVTVAYTLDNEQYTDVYSVAQYAKEILAVTDEDSLIALLVKSMLAYGAAAQKQFDRYTDKLANDGIDYTPAAESIDAPALPVKNTEYSGITYYGCTLLLKSDTVLRFYFKNVDDAQKITLDDKTPANPEDTYVYVEMGGIKATDLNNTYTLKVGDEEVGTCSAASYIKSVLDNSTDETLKATVTALYDFGQRATAYFDSLKNQ